MNHKARWSRGTDWLQNRFADNGGYLQHVMVRSIEPTTSTSLPTRTTRGKLTPIWGVEDTSQIFARSSAIVRLKLACNYGFRMLSMDRRALIHRFQYSHQQRRRPQNVKICMLDHCLVSVFRDWYPSGAALWACTANDAVDRVLV